MVRFAKGFITEKGIARRSELQGADRGLYKVLRERKLLDAVFSGVEPSGRDEGKGEILRKIKEALGEYSGDVK